MDIKKNSGEVANVMGSIESMKTINENLEHGLQQKGLSPEQINNNIDQIKASVGGELNKATQVLKDGVSFTGTYNYHMGKMEEHGRKSRALERKANDLENDIKRKREPESRTEDVKKWLKEAKEEKDLEQKHKGLAKQALQQSNKTISFEGQGNCGRRCDKLDMVSVNLAK